jgi:hypothetical protein
LLFGGPQLPLYGRAIWYSGQGRAIRSLGETYEDVGKVKVIATTRQGLVAQVTFACGPLARNDIAIPFQPRPIPSYDRSLKFDRFTPLPEKSTKGFIAAAQGNAGALSNDSVAYVSLGAKDGAQAGQRYRIFHVDRDLLGGWRPWGNNTPTETIGELVILFAEETSSVGIVTSNVREIYLGDGVTPE